jgi:hypothetical protein
MDSRELAWAAGLFEGEGSFVEHRVNKRSMSTQISMTDLDSLERFWSAVGVGTIAGPYQYASQGRDRSSHKPYYKWAVYGFENVQYVVALLWFGLGVRRRARATEVLALRGGPRGRNHRYEQEEAP